MTNANTQTMTLIERLRNPMWVRSNHPFMDNPQLDTDENLITMLEAATEIERLRRSAVLGVCGQFSEVARAPAQAPDTVRAMPVMFPDKNSASGYWVEYLNCEVDANLAKALDACALPPALAMTEGTCICSPHQQPRCVHFRMGKCAEKNPPLPGRQRNRDRTGAQAGVREDFLKLREAVEDNRYSAEAIGIYVRYMWPQLTVALSAPQAQEIQSASAAARASSDATPRSPASAAMSQSAGVDTAAQPSQDGVLPVILTGEIACILEDCSPPENQTPGAVAELIKDYQPTWDRICAALRFTTPAQSPDAVRRALEQIADIAEGSRTINSLYHIAKIARATLSLPPLQGRQEK